MNEVTIDDIEQLCVGLVEKIDQHGVQLRKEIKESADSVLEVINAMAVTSSSRFTQIEQKLNDLTTELIFIKRQINNINSDIDKAFKKKYTRSDYCIDRRAAALGAPD